MGKNMSQKILIIEDNDQNLYMMTFLLEAHGFEIIAARDGKTGVALANQMNPAVILLDIQLPGMDGYAVAAALRSTAGLERVPIVAVTSFAMLGDREKILSAGATDYIEKPINPDTFVEQIKKHVPKNS
jgi:CheY-like chemotaxis protein